MKKQAVLIASNDEILRKATIDAYKNDVIPRCEIDMDIKSSEDRERLGNLPDDLIYHGTSLNPGSNQHQVARKLRDIGSKCLRILLASTGDLIKQHKQFPKASLVSNYFAHQKEQASQKVGDIKWKHFREWFRKDSSSAFQDIAIEGDGVPLGNELVNKIEEIRRDKDGEFSKRGVGLNVPIKVAIRGLGKQGLGILEQAVQNDNIYEIHVHTKFVNGEYKELLAPYIDVLERAKAEKIITHERAEELIEVNPDVVVIAAGPHGVDYSGYGDRDELTEFLFKSTAPEVDELVDMGTIRNFKGLWLPQSNPNAHLIKYIRNRGKFQMDQISSIPPDTPRHRVELYYYLKQIDPEIKESDIGSEFIAVGDHHTTAGIPLYSRATVKGKPLLEVYPKLQDPEVRMMLYKNVRDEGLKIMQSSEKYRHDYRGVPKVVAACLEDISCLKHYPRYPMYSGLVSVPTRFIYRSDEEDNNMVNIRVRKVGRLRETIDRDVREDLIRQSRDIQAQTNKWVEELKNK